MTTHLIRRPPSQTKSSFLLYPTHTSSPVFVCEQLLIVAAVNLEYGANISKLAIFQSPILRSLYFHSLM